jgi:DnaJ-class molecular chaperone
MTPALPPAEIRALARLLDELDYYQLLEVTPGAPTSDVKRSYYTLQRRFHPDANRGLDADTRGCLETIARRISEAYAVLRDPRRRKSYDGQRSDTDSERRMPLVGGEEKAHREGIEETLGRTPNGRRFFALARADIDKGQLDSAQRNLKMALTFEPANDFFRQKLDEVKQALRG